MRTSSKGGLLILVGGAVTWANLLQEPLGLPGWAGVLLALGGAAIVCYGALLLRRAKKGGEISAPQLTPQQYRRRLTLALLAVVLPSLTLPFYAPYTGVTLPFPLLIICAILSCVLSVAIVWRAMRQHRPKA